MKKDRYTNHNFDQTEEKRTEGRTRKYLCAIRNKNFVFWTCQMILIVLERIEEKLSNWTKSLDRFDKQND